jgi:hypothetical protein
MQPKRIRPEQRLDLKLTLQERDLIIERTSSMLSWKNASELQRRSGRDSSFS